MSVSPCLTNAEEYDFNNKTYHLTNELLAKPYHTGNDDRDKTNLKPIKSMQHTRLKSSFPALPQRSPKLRLCITISNNRMQCMLTHKHTNKRQSPTGWPMIVLTYDLNTMKL